MSTLYKINRAIAKCFTVDENHVVDGETGEVLDKQYLDDLKASRKIKIDNICCFIKNLKAEAEACQKEADAFKKRADAAKKKASDLTEYLVLMMPDHETLTTKRAKIGWRKSVKVTITDEQEIPKSYIKVKEVRSVDKTEIRKQLKEGLTIPGAELTECQNIQIK